MRVRLTALLHLLAPLALFAADDELARLRAQYAERFFDPKSHLRLSRHLAQKGDRLTAFYLSEAARRNHFGEEEFDAAFRSVFRGDDFDNSAAAEKKAAAEVAAKPDDPKAYLRLADIFLSRGEWKKAEKEIRAAIRLAPDSSESTEVLAEVLRRDEREAEAEALQRDWYEKHPDSAEAMNHRAEKLIAGKSPEAAAFVEAALEAHPRDAMLHFQHAYLLQLHGDDKGAVAEYVQAAELDPGSAYIQGWTARFFLKRLGNNERALHYYLNAYFLDPHFYDTEYAESRIRTLAYERAQNRFGAARKSGTALEKLLADADPVVAGFAMDEADTTGSKEVAAAVFALLRHDDPNLRYRAASVLAHHIDGDDERVSRLLIDEDLRVRGTAAYLAGAAKRAGLVPLMVSWAVHPADLIQYDAISVLSMHGGKPGRDALAKLKKDAPIMKPRVRAMLDAVLSGEARPVE